MLNEREKALAKELLDLISPDDLASLASTSSNNMIIVNNSQGKILMCLNYFTVDKLMKLSLFYYVNLMLGLHNR